MEAEFLDLKQRLDAGLVGIRIGGAVNLQAFAGDLEALDHGNVKASQFARVLETGCQCFDDPGAQNRFGAYDRDANTNGSDHEKKQENAGDPAPAMRTPASPWRDKVYRLLREHGAI